jgi:HYDIN/CFA65/VesB family protein
MRRLILFTCPAVLLVLVSGLACSKRSTGPTEPGAACSVSPTTLDFGSVAIGFSPEAKTFTMSNTGGGTLTGSVSESCPDFDVTAGGGDYSLTAGESRIVAVRFHPQSIGAKSCVMTTGCSQSVTLTGTGAAARCMLDPTNLDFGSVAVGQFLDRTFQLRNTGPGGVTISGTITESCPEFSLVGSTTYSLNGGQTATFTVRFAPSAAGSKSCTINTGSEGCATLPASGTGVAVSADCEVSPDGLSFGEVPIGSRADATFTIRNNGTSRLTGSVSESCPGFSIPGATSYDLAAGASQTFIVRFEPTSEGMKICSVNTGSSCAVLSVSGTGQVGCEFTPTVLDLGIVRYGGNGFREFTLTNHTSSQLYGTFYPPYPFVVRTLQGVLNTFAVPPHGSQILTVGFHPPTGAGICDSTLYGGPIRTDSPLCGTVQVSGIATWGCDCTVSPTVIDFGEVVVGESSAPANLNVRNTSHLPGAAGTIRVISGDFFAPATYRCATCSPCNTVVEGITFHPARLGPQTGKIVIDLPERCFGGGTPCDTVTVTGYGITALTAPAHR